MAPNILGLALGFFFTWTGMGLAKPEVRKVLVRNLIAYVTVVLGAITVVSPPSSASVHLLCALLFQHQPFVSSSLLSLTRSIDAARTR
eukprot:1742984-Rhodomonas_salina.1